MTLEQIVQRGYRVSLAGDAEELSGHNPVPCRLGQPCWAGSLDQMPPCGPLEPDPFCDSMRVQAGKGIPRARHQHADVPALQGLGEPGAGLPSPAPSPLKSVCWRVQQRHPSSPSTFSYCEDYRTLREYNVNLIPQRLLETQHLRPRRHYWILLNASKLWISKKSAQTLTGASAESLGCNTWGSHAAMLSSSRYCFVVLSMDPVVILC